jgi:hypothetical protein
MIYVILATTKQRRERAKKCIDAIQNSTISHSLVIYENYDGGHVAATRNVLKGINGEIFLINDDMIVEVDCIEMLKKSYDENFPSKDGVCQPKDSIHQGRLAVSPYCHTDTIRPFLEDYNHYFWDAEFSKVMYLMKKYIIVENAILDHQHFTSCDNIIRDETYILNSKKKHLDSKIYEERLKNNFSHRFKNK